MGGGLDSDSHQQDLIYEQDHHQTVYSKQREHVQIQYVQGCPGRNKTIGRLCEQPITIYSYNSPLVAVAIMIVALF